MRERCLGIALFGFIIKNPVLLESLNYKLNRILNFGKKSQINERMQAEAKEKDLLLYKAYENLQILARKINDGTKEEFLAVSKDLKISELLSGFVDSMEFSYTDEDSLKVIIDDFKLTNSTQFDDLTVKATILASYIQIREGTE